MRNFAASSRTAPATTAFTVNLGLRWSYYDGNDSGAGQRRRRVGRGLRGLQQSFPEISRRISWNTFAPRTGVVWQADRGRQERRQGELQPLLRVDVHDRVQHINANGISHRRRRDLRVERRVRLRPAVPVLGTLEEPVRGQVQHDRSEPQGSEERRDHVRVQRELASNVSFNVDWIQRWFHDVTVDQDCYGLPCNTVASTAYTPRSRHRLRPGQPQRNGATTGDRRSTTCCRSTSARTRSSTPTAATTCR